MIRGEEFTNCNCAYGCPCQFNSPTTHGSCEALAATRIDEGHFNDARLDGLNIVLLVQWPGEIAEGNGREQFIIDERADEAQREALVKIMKGESTEPGATHFFVFNSTMSEVLDPIFARIELEVDVEMRTARVSVPDILEAKGAPIENPHSGEAFEAAIVLAKGFEYARAEMGSGTSRVRAGIELDLRDSYGQFNLLHMTQDGVVR